MISKCPGQDKRNIRVDSLVCHSCGYNMEIFSDELKAACPRCRNISYRERLPSCLDWCKSAQLCVGPQKWKSMKGE